jgi:hypothetical protein
MVNDWAISAACAELKAAHAMNAIKTLLQCFMGRRLSCDALVQNVFLTVTFLIN